MAHANWKGHLKLSLVSCPVALFPATTLNEKVSFHFLNKANNHRLKQQYIDAETDEIVERDDRIRGYEVSKGKYVTVGDDELAAVTIESSHTMEIDSFVARADIDPIYSDASYYLAPDDDVGVEAFGVIRAAMETREMVGMARVVLYGRERIVTLEPRGKGILVTTLHYAYEIRDDAELFADIPSKEPPRELLDLASHIIDTKVGHFRPVGFKDAYQDAVLALIHAKQKGKAAPAPAHAKTECNVINLADALRRSLGGGATKQESRVKKVKTKGAKAKTTAKRAPAKRRSAKAPRSPARKAS